MFHNLQLSSTISADRQLRFRDAATRQRLVRRNKVPPTDRPVGLLSVVWPDEADALTSQQRASCVA